MSEKNFGGVFSDPQSTAPHAENAGNDFDVHQLHNDIPHIETPGPQIGPGFLNEKDPKLTKDENIEKEANREKLEVIKQIILERDINLVKPGSSYRLLVKDLNDMGLFRAELKTDINFFFNQKLLYCYNKENLKSDNNESSDALKKKTQAAFAGAKSLHDIVEKLEKIEENGGSDEKINEYWKSREAFYMNLKESEIEPLLNKEEMLMDNLQNAQKFGAIAEKVVRNLIKNSSEYLKEMISKNEALRDIFEDGLIISIKEASISEDVYRAIDFYVEIGEKRFPVQVKCGNVDVKYGEDEKTLAFIMNNLVNMVDDEDRFNYKSGSCYYENKMTEKLNKFVQRAFIKNNCEKGFFIILPRGKGMLRENGDIDDNVKKLFFDQLYQEISSLEFN
ncbi:MAG: hypothetical protein WC788_06145 [Candidatus Paceibacterota bacterium]|jgi:hypothetical protein